MCGKDTYTKQMSLKLTPSDLLASFRSGHRVKTVFMQYGFARCEVCEQAKCLFSMSRLTLWACCMLLVVVKHVNISYLPRNISSCQVGLPTSTYSFPPLVLDVCFHSLYLLLIIIIIHGLTVRKRMNPAVTDWEMATGLEDLAWPANRWLM